MSAQSSNGKWIAHPADRLNTVPALAAPLLLFAPFAVDLFAGFEAAYAAAAFMLAGNTNYLLHLHIHRPRKPGLNRLSRRFQFGIEVGDDVLERGDGLLDRRNLHQFPAADRAIAILQRDDQIPSLLLKLNKR
jgi:hypothetical protein